MLYRARFHLFHLWESLPSAQIFYHAQISLTISKILEIGSNWNRLSPSDQDPWNILFSATVAKVHLCALNRPFQKGPAMNLEALHRSSVLWILIGVFSQVFIGLCLNHMPELQISWTNHAYNRNWCQMKLLISIS